MELYDSTDFKNCQVNQRPDLPFLDLATALVL